MAKCKIVLYEGDRVLIEREVDDQVSYAIYKELCVKRELTEEEEKELHPDWAEDHIMTLWASTAEKLSVAKKLLKETIDYDMNFSLYDKIADFLNREQEKVENFSDALYDVIKFCKDNAIDPYTLLDVYKDFIKSNLNKLENE